ALLALIRSWWPVGQHNGQQGRAELRRGRLDRVGSGPQSTSPRAARRTPDERPANGQRLGTPLATAQSGGRPAPLGTSAARRHRTASTPTPANETHPGWRRAPAQKQAPAWRDKALARWRHARRLASTGSPDDCREWLRLLGRKAWTVAQTEAGGFTDRWTVRRSKSSYSAGCLSIDPPGGPDSSG